jgi:hypothetical protein
MKRFIRIMAVSVFAVAVFAANAMAWQITQDISAERTQSRNATEGQVSAAYYNPAGLTNLEEGIYIDIGNRMLALKKTTGAAWASMESNSDTFAPLLPNLALIWRGGNGALYFTTTIVGGGAGGSWEHDDLLTIGSNTTLTLGSFFDSLDGTTFTIGYTMGGAGRINDMIAVSGGVRLLQRMATANYSGANVANAGNAETIEESGYGVQGVFGIMITPMEGLNIAVNVYTESYIKITETSTFVNDWQTYSDESVLEPMMIAIGIGYDVTDQLNIQISYNFTAEGDESHDGGATYPHYQDGDNNSHKIGFGAEFQVMDMLLVSLGIAYETTGNRGYENNGISNFNNPGLDKMVYGIGAVITPIENISLDLGFAYHQYLEGEMQYRDVAASKVTHNQTAVVFGFGVSASF